MSSNGDIQLTHQVFSPNLLLGTPLYLLKQHVSLCLQRKLRIKKNMFTLHSYLL